MTDDTLEKQIKEMEKLILRQVAITPMPILSSGRWAGIDMEGKNAEDGVLTIEKMIAAKKLMEQQRYVKPDTIWAKSHFCTQCDNRPGNMSTIAKVGEFIDRGSICEKCFLGGKLGDICE